MKHIVVLSGAGISAESGLRTFRDADGLWEGHDVMGVASVSGFATDPALVLDFYNQRRRQLLQVEPNAAHTALAKIQDDFQVTVITQNVDDLHERAGSRDVVHLHGELLKSRSVLSADEVYECIGDIHVGDLAPDGGQLRPHIVWFGESVPMMDKAVSIVEKADVILIVGTSMQVYPAASLIEYATHEAMVFYVDPKPQIGQRNIGSKPIHVIHKVATKGVLEAIQIIYKTYL